MSPLHMAVENSISTVFTLAPSIAWGTSFATAGFRMSEVAGNHSKAGKVVLSICCLLFLTSFTRASAQFVMSGSRFLFALIVLAFAGFFVGTVFGTLWRDVPPK